MARAVYQARYKNVYMERARSSFLDLAVYDDGALAAPSAGTVSVFNPAGTAAVDAAAVTVTGSIATYTIAVNTLDSESFGPGWRVEWTLTMPDTNSHVFRHDAALVRVRLGPVITDVDLIARHSDLASYRPSGLSDWEDYIEESWREIEGRLEAMGRRPYLIISPQALRPVHLFLTLANIFTDFGGTGDDDNRWVRLAREYHERSEAEWRRTSLVYDEDDSGGEGSAMRDSLTPSIWLTGRP